VVTGVPDQIIYGSSFEFDASGGPAVASAMLMRPCAVTHSVDMDQRAVILNISGGAARVTVQIPTDHSLAPPGYYMLFFVAADGTPSEAKFVLLRDGVPTYPPLYLGTYSGDCVIEEAFDGDLTLEKIDQHCKVILTSRHGSITIKHKIDQWSYASLKAATTVHIGEGIDQHSQAEIVAGGDVTIGQTIDENSQVSITSTAGKIDIGLNVDNYSQANLTAGATVHIGQKVDQHSVVTINAQGDVTLDQGIDQHATVDIVSLNGSIIMQRVNETSIVTLTAGMSVHISEKFDQHSQVTVVAQGDVYIDQKIDQHSVAKITSAKGSINIGQGLSGNATATLIADNGSINIGDSVDSGSAISWRAQQFNCPHQDGTIHHI
jgi:hypothetical protein